MLDHFYFRLLFPDMRKRIVQCRALHIMAAIMMLVYSLQFVHDFNENWMQLLVIIPPALIVLFFAIFKKNFITENNNNRVFRILEIGVLLMGAMGFLKSNQVFPAMLFGLFSLVLLFILYMENRIFTHQYIDVTKAGLAVSLPTHTKKISWNEIKNITLRDDYFTVETTNDIIRQYRMFNSMTPDEAIQFSEFCKKNIQG